MKEIRPLGFAHLMSGMEANWRTGCGLTSSPLRATCWLWGPTRGAMGLGVDNGKLAYKFCAYDNSNDPAKGARGYCQIPLSDFIGSRTDYQSFVFGFRFKSLIAPAAANTNYMGLAFAAVTGDGANNAGIPLFVGPAAGQHHPEGYYEFEIFPYSVGGKCDIYLDGVLWKTVALPADSRVAPANISGCQFAMGNGNTEMMIQGSTLGVSMFTMEDMYVAWSNVPGESVRQGPIKVRPLPVLSVSTPNWTSSDGTKTPVEVLNLANHSGSVLTPVVSSDAASTPLRVKLDTTNIKSSDKVLAVSGLVSARKPTGQATTYSAKWSHSSGDSDAVTATPTNGTWDIQKDVRIGVLSATPGGAALTKTNVGQLELVITPNG